MCGFDDTLFNKFMEDVKAAEELISTIMGKQIAIKSVNPQKKVQNLVTRSVILDALCEDCDGNYFNVEVQKQDNDDHQRRVRYNGSNIDISIAEKGSKFNELPDVYIIYISKFDIFQQGKNYYEIVRTISGTDYVVDNGFHEIYVNAAVKGNDIISELMEVLENRGLPDNSNFPNICESIKYYKSEKGGANMCKLVEDYAREYAEERLEEKLKEITKKLLEMQLPIADIIRATNLSEEEILELKYEY